MGEPPRQPARTGRGLRPLLSAPLVVVDTSGVVAHLTASSDGTPSGRVLHACGTGEVRTALSDASLREVVEVVRRPRVEPQIRSASRAFVAAMDLWSHGTLFYPTRFDWPTLVDRKDHWVLDLAWASLADFIVSVDPHLTGPTMPFPVEAVEPDQLLARLP